MKVRNLLLATALLTSTGSLSAAVAQSHEHVSVTIKSYAYAPNPFDVRVGDTIVWTNEDSAPHTITSASGPTKLDSPELGKGDSWSFTASRPGSYRYYCAVHPDMKAGFTVLPTASTSPTAAPTTAATSATATSATATPSTAAAPGRTAPTATAPARPTRSASRARAAALPASSPTASPGPAEAVDTSPASPTKTLDPALLLVAITVGAVAMALLALGRRQKNAQS